MTLRTDIPDGDPTLLPNYYECPDTYQPAPDHPPAVFLAGGITGVEDWQTPATIALARHGVIVLTTLAETLAACAQLTQPRIG
ncbi:hypothetical protein DF19_07255 [Streptomyces olindensis]|nr:hypothetical protein DF19_07255 [Streptomyces olindensis]